MSVPPRTMIAPATADDRGEVEQLLVACDLPLDGLADAFPAGFAVARLDGQLIGAAGVEVWSDAAGAHGLLRSVAVAPSQRGRHLAEALVADRRAWARARGLATLSLLTTGAADYFARLGFEPIARDALPAALAGSSQLAIPRCSTATAMIDRLAGSR